MKKTAFVFLFIVSASLIFSEGNTDQNDYFSQFYL